MTVMPLYQVVLLGADPEPLPATLWRHMQDLGLPPEALAVLTEETIDQLDSKLPRAVAFFGPYPHSDTAAALAAQRLPILPVVPTLTDYHAQVPPCLHGINGRAQNDADIDRKEVADWLLEELGLLPRQRRVFISYRRSEATGAAIQLYHALHERQFQPFLDTYSIRHGQPVAALIGDSLVETDLLILLGTRDVFASRWVEHEFTRANELGVGILYLAWPGHKPPAFAGFSPPQNLAPESFIGHHEEVNAELNKDTVERIHLDLESLRAASFAARQRRLIDSFCRKMGKMGFQAQRTPDRYLAVTSTSASFRVYPTVGRPNARLVHEVHEHCEGHRAAAERACLLYDDQGLLPETVRHLNWLNRHAPVRTLSVDEAADWVKAS